MLVVHWAKQNTTNDILANGIKPASRKLNSDYGVCTGNVKGVYVYPFSRNKTQRGVWRRQLKRWDNILGNYNGFVFRLNPSDFPLVVGYWWSNRMSHESNVVDSLGQLHEAWGDIFSSRVVDSGYEWEDFEIIVTSQIAPRRIIKVLRDREPQR